MWQVRDAEGDKPAQLDDSFEYANEILVSSSFCIFTAAENEKPINYVDQTHTWHSSLVIQSYWSTLSNHQFVQ